MKTFNRIKPAASQQALPLPRRKRGGRVNIENIAAYRAEIVWQAHSQLSNKGRINIGEICRTWAITPGGPSYRHVRVALLEAGFTLAQLSMLPPVEPEPPATAAPEASKGIDTTPFTYYAGA